MDFQYDGSHINTCGLIVKGQSMKSKLEEQYNIVSLKTKSNRKLSSLKCLVIVCSAVLSMFSGLGTRSLGLYTLGTT